MTLQTGLLSLASKDLPCASVSVPSLTLSNLSSIDKAAVLQSVIHAQVPKNQLATEP